MSKYLTSLLIPLALGGTLTASAADIFPKPRNMTASGASAFPSAGTTFRLTGADDADAQAVASLSSAISPSASGSVEIIVGEAGDPAVASLSDKIPANEQGYYLSVAPGRVVIAGRDGYGTYYGVLSFLQLLEDNDAVAEVEVTDWPATPVRGVIEGYYGNPWSHDDCLDMFEFFDRNRMNTFIYGPKNDPYHRGRWAEPYPDDQAAALSELAREGLRHKVNFVWAMHPGNSITGDNPEKARLKFEKMYELGIRQFAVFFDDIGGQNVDAQVEYLNFINQKFIHAHDDIAPLIMCPTEYCISFAGGWNTQSTYLPTLGKGLDDDIEIMWTGAGVVDMNQDSAADWFTQRTGGRKPFIWLNYPVTDYGYEGGPLLLSPYQPAADGIHSKTTAFCSNPMEYYEASKIALYGIGEFSWNPEGYDPWDNWHSAIRFIMPDDADALETYCYSNFYYPSNTHGLRVAYDETPEFTAITANTPDLTTASAPTFSAYFDNQIATADHLLSLSSSRLVKEIAEWIEVYRMQGERGLLLADLRAALDAHDGDAFANAYREYTALTDSAETHYSRYGWEVRNFLPKSAPQFVEPFIKAQAIALANEYRDGDYDVPSDLFPPQIVDNGTYYIVYDGKLLSNGSGEANDTPRFPTFRAEIDDVNSARQAWIIRYDMELDRYSIISAFDDRYINEKGEFTVNASTNPFEPAWHTYLIRELGGNFAIRNGGSAGSNFWTTDGTRISKGEHNDKSPYDPADFMFQIIPVSDEITPAEGIDSEAEYVITDLKGHVLRRNNNDLEFIDAPETLRASHKWHIALDSVSNRFKISQGDKFINEKGRISVNAYYPDWNSYELYGDGHGRYAIRNADKAGTDFWIISNGLIEKGGNLNLMDAFQFIIRRADKYSGIDAVEADNSSASVAGGAYDIMGRPVDAASARGFIILDGKKIVR